MSDNQIQELLLDHLNRLAGSPISAVAPVPNPSATPVTAATNAGDPLPSLMQAVARLPAATSFTGASSLMQNLAGGNNASSASLQSTLLAPALSGIVAGLKFLFGGGRSAEPALISRYIAPPPLRLEQAISDITGASPASYDRDAQGLPRLSAGAPIATPQNITVNIQTIDQRSFLDHSTEIANALREAMLQSHSINDLLSEY